MTSGFIGPTRNAQRDAARDPITRMQMFLIREGILDEKGINKLEKQVEDDLQIAVDQALEAALPTPDTITEFIYSPDLDPTLRVFETEPAFPQVAAPADGKKLPLRRPWPI